MIGVQRRTAVEWWGHIFIQLPLSLSTSERPVFLVCYCFTYTWATGLKRALLIKNHWLTFTIWLVILNFIPLQGLGLLTFPIGYRTFVNVSTTLLTLRCSVVKLHIEVSSSDPLYIVLRLTYRHHCPDELGLWTWTTFFRLLQIVSKNIRTLYHKFLNCQLFPSERFLVDRRFPSWSELANGQPRSNPIHASRSYICPLG